MNSTLPQTPVRTSTLHLLCEGLIEHIDMPAMIITLDGEVLAANGSMSLYTGEGEDVAGRHVFNETSVKSLSSMVQWGKMLASERGMQGGYLDTELGDFRRAERFEITLDQRSLYLIKLVVANPIGLTAQEQYQQMFMGHCSAMIVVQKEGLKILDVNQAAADLYKTTRETLMRLTLPELEVSSDRGDSYEGYRTHTHAVGGERRIMESYGSSLNLHGIETFFLTVHDVTEREQAHIMLSTQERLLAAGEAVCRIGCWEWDLRSGETSWTQQMYEILGEDEVIDLQTSQARVDERDRLRFELFFECLSDYEEVEHLRQEIDKDGGDSFNIEYRYHRPDGKIVNLEIRLEVIVNDELRVVEAFRGSLQDITEMREREAEISHYARKLERVNQSLEEFTSMASHDLREPARKVVAFGERLMKHQQDSFDARGKTYLDRMIKAGKRMDNMINSLLELSTCSPEVAKKVTRIQVRDLLDDVVSILEVRIEETDAVLDLREACGVIEGDYGQLTHLFQNLVGNAIKFSREGEGPHVKVSTECMGNAQLRIHVVDDGIGMDPEHAKDIFKPFKRLHGKCSSYQGNGIGLSICKKIAEAHGGKITVESAPGEGSRFMVDLPVPESV